MRPAQLQSHKCCELKKSSLVSNCERSRSRKKYIEVFSKSKAKDGSKISNHLRNSSASLQVSSTEPPYHSQSIYQSQVKRPLDCYPGNISRSESLSSLKGQQIGYSHVIVRETVRAVPVKFSYAGLGPRTNEHRHSLPVKHAIVMQECPSTTKKSILGFNQWPCNPQIKRMSHSNLFSNHHLLPNTPKQAKQKPVIADQRGLSECSQSKQLILSNEKYLSDRICIMDCNPSAVAMGKENVGSGYEKQAGGCQTQNYNSLVITKENAQKNMQHRLDIGLQTCKSECICDKIKSFTECSEIKINKRQALQPKKNFVFV